MKEFQQLSAENNPQYEFERGGFANTEIRQSSRSTGDPDKENKKSKKKRSTSESSVGADPQQRERKVTELAPLLHMIGRATCEECMYMYM